MPMKKIKELTMKYREFILYVMFGGLSTLVSWGSYALLELSGLSVALANALSWVLSVCFAFVTNKFFVFESTSWKLSTTLREAGEFFGARFLTGLLTMIGVPLLVKWGVDIPIHLGEKVLDGMVAKLIMTVLEIILNYIVSKLIIFRKK